MNDGADHQWRSGNNLAEPSDALLTPLTCLVAVELTDLSGTVGLDLTIPTVLTTTSTAYC